LQLDNRKLVAFLGAEPHTPLETALFTTLTGLGCMGGYERAERSSPPDTHGFLAQRNP
jgi:hypothetical protein